MKINFFPFFKRTKRKDPVKKSVSAGDEYQKRIHEKNLSKINERVDVHVKRFARNHRAVVKESDLAVLHDATKRISSEDISRFLSVVMLKNYLCFSSKMVFVSEEKMHSSYLPLLRVSLRAKRKFSIAPRINIIV